MSNAAPSAAVRSLLARAADLYRSSDEEPRTAGELLLEASDSRDAYRAALDLLGEGRSERGYDAWLALTAAWRASRTAA